VSKKLGIASADPGEYRQAAGADRQRRAKVGVCLWRRIRTNNPLERILREIRRRTRVVGSFPDGQSALNLAVARLRHIAGTAWSTKRYLNIELLKDQQMRGAITA
jgi:transposase-like protein